MGAGCYYTCDIDRERAVWLDISEQVDSGEWWVGDFESDIEECLKGSIWEYHGFEIFSPAYDIKLETTYNGDGLVLNMLEQRDENALLTATCRASYWKLVDRLCKRGYSFYIATSGYTADKYTPRS